MSSKLTLGNVFFFFLGGIFLGGDWELLFFWEGGWVRGREKGVKLNREGRIIGEEGEGEGNGEGEGKEGGLERWG